MKIVEENRSIRDLNTLKLAGTAAAYAEVHSRNELTEVLQQTHRKPYRIVPLGEGSNVVLGSMLNVLLLRYMKQGFKVIDESTEHITLRVAAGQNWHQLVMHCVQNEWYGLENLALIPGTVGAAPIQNIGAYGVELNQFVVSVSGVFLPQHNTNQACEVFQFSVSDCHFGYRNSIFRGELRDRVLITSVDLKLSKKFNPELGYPALSDFLHNEYGSNSGVTPRQLCDAVIAIRQSKLPDPDVLPNAGSFFKNVIVSEKENHRLKTKYPDMPCFPVENSTHYKIPAAWLVEQCGFKGRQGENGIGVHEKQAIVLVNRGAEDNVTASELLSFAKTIQQAVSGRFGLELEIEPQIYE